MSSQTPIRGGGLSATVGGIVAIIDETAKFLMDVIVEQEGLSCEM